MLLIHQMDFPVQRINLFSGTLPQTNSVEAHGINSCFSWILLPNIVILNVMFH
jgi:hypothetical protein